MRKFHSRSRLYLAKLMKASPLVAESFGSAQTSRGNASAGSRYRQPMPSRTLSMKGE